MAMPYRPLDAQPGHDRATAAVDPRLPADAVPRAAVRARRAERHGERRAARHRPPGAQEHGALTRRRLLRLPPVRHRRRPAADRAGLALRPVEGPAGRHRRLQAGPGGGAGRPARARRLDGQRRPRGVGLLQRHRGARRRRPRHLHPQQLQQRRLDRGQRVPVACRRGGAEVDPRGVRPDGQRGALEEQGVRRRRRRRHPAAGRAGRQRVPRQVARAVRRAVRRHPAGPGAGQGAGPARQGARAQALPDAALPARLPEDLQRRARHRPRGGAGADDGGRGRGVSGQDERRPLILVSNRGPVTFDDEGGFKRGTGGLVTALTGLASHREVVWIASALTEGDKHRVEEADGKSFEIDTAGDGTFQVRMVVSDDDAYDRFYNIFANPMLWFIQHYLWDLSNAPDVRRHEIEAFEFGYNVVNEDLAKAVVEEIEGVDEPVVMVHDYHLYTLPALVRKARPDAFLHHFVHIPWTQPDAWRVLPRGVRTEIFEGLLANDIIGFHTRSYRWNFLQCCRDLLDNVEVDFEAGIVRFEDREVWVRAYPLPIDAQAIRRTAQSERVAEFEAELLRRRREHLVLRVDRADLSKNVLRGFTAFDLFLEQHPEFREKVTFVAQLMPSRTDVPEYAEYLERIEAIVAVVNHRHGTPDWMPIQLKLKDDLEDAVAAYKNYDVLLVNAMFDGMNLVAKEGPMVNERHGVSILSENTGAHEELGEFALSVNLFDIQELADSIHAALTMAPRERQRRAKGLHDIITARDPGDWIDDQIADIRKKAGVEA